MTDRTPDTKASDDTAHDHPKSGMARWLVETVLLIVAAFLLAQGFKTFIIQPFVIPTGSMETAIMTGDRVLAEKISYRFRSPQAGEIVVFDDPTGRHPQLIKRIIATGGQTVDILNGQMVVDGVTLDEPYVDLASTDVGTVPLPVTLGPDEYWLMGDNRPNSGDSRFMGAIPSSMIRGHAFAIYWPLDRIDWLSSQ